MSPKLQIIEQLTKPSGELLPPEPRRWDLQDGLLCFGFAALEAGVGAIYWPAALILAGLLCFGFAYLIEKTRAKESRRGTPQS